MIPLFNRFYKSFIKRGIILMYHRVANVEYDPWNLAVTPENFEQQLKVLADEYNVTPIERIAQQIKTKSISSKTIGITFDDGYRDNYNFALPILNKKNLSATFYISSFYIGKNNRFWWDELLDIILKSPKLPNHIHIKIQKEEIDFHLDEEAELTEQNKRLQKNWKVKDKAPTKRCELYFQIWNSLKPQPVQETQIVMDSIKKWSCFNPQAIDENDLPMTSDHLNEFCQNKNLNLGLHTSTHVALGSHPHNFQEEEIISNRNILETRFKQSITTLTYPYGSFNDTTISIVNKLKLSAAFTTKRKSFTSNTNLYQIGRFGVQNWNGEEFKMHLKKWFKKY